MAEDEKQAEATVRVLPHAGADSMRGRVFYNEIVSVQCTPLVWRIPKPGRLVPRPKTKHGFAARAVQEED